MTFALLVCEVLQMKNYLRHLLSVSIAFSVGLSPFVAYAGNTNVVSVSSANNANQKAKESISYLLSIDRLHFYIQNLADFLDGKKSPEVISILRDITPENIYALAISQHELDTPANWQSLIEKLANIKKPNVVNSADLEWNYNFFKNKLMERFAVKDFKDKEIEKLFFFEEEAEIPRKRSVPKIKGSKSMLDVERYIAEKTSRAIIWDATLNDRDFEFHIGTQRDFKGRMDHSDTTIISEIYPMARNYNKIFLAFNKKTNRYCYIMNLISGDDRIKHLIAQLRLIRFNGKGFLTTNRDKVHVYGSASEFHKRQTEELLEIYNRLPKADKIIIGQKGAIDDAIRSAGMLNVISKNVPEVLIGLQLEPSKKTKFENLAKNANEVSNFLLDAMNPGPVKIDAAYEKTNDIFDRVYKQFNSEQPSHEFADYLLEDAHGNLKRWRVISAVWGDEIIPIADAIKLSGHKDVVYIGTAGAIAGKGIKVGDVIPGSNVITHSGKTLEFAPGKLVAKAEERKYTVGQVHTPFDETDVWLKTKGAQIDIVEVETGYLRERLGPEIKLEAYFLVSDIVGSEDETLAHAAQNSSKRKRRLLRLLENVFVKNEITTPISNFEPTPMDSKFKIIFNRLVELRRSRDIYSLMQVAYLAVRQGVESPEQLQTLLKSQPSFDRADLDYNINSLGSFLAEIQSVLPSNYKVGIISENLLNGTYNPKVKTKIDLMAEGHVEDNIKKKIGLKKWATYMEELKKYFDIEFIDYDAPESLMAKRFYINDASDFFELFEQEVLFRSGFATELDAKGNLKAKEIPGLRKDAVNPESCKVIFQ